MPELKNNFAGAKMNSDVDKRLLPKNEYRDAQNISIPESTDDGAGSAEALSGNILNYADSLGLSDATDVIGYYVDERTNRVYWFVTDQTKYSRGSNITNPATPVQDLPDS